LCNKRLPNRKIKLQISYNRRKYIGPKESDLDWVSHGHNISSKDEVDAVMAQAKNVGAVIVKPVQVTFWGGYAGYFQDHDQHLWEVVWNPQWAIKE